MKFKNILNPNYTDHNWRKPLVASSNPLALEEIALQSAADRSPPEPPSKNDGREELPKLRKRTATTAMELFFDLFFVANLGSFTGSHDINTTQSMNPGYSSFVTYQRRRVQY